MKHLCKKRRNVFSSHHCYVVIYVQLNAVICNRFCRFSGDNFSFFFLFSFLLENSLFSRVADSILFFRLFCMRMCWPYIVPFWLSIGIPELWSVLRVQLPSSRHPLLHDVRRYRPIRPFFRHRRFWCNQIMARFFFSCMCRRSVVIIVVLVFRGVGVSHIGCKG